MSKHSDSSRTAWLPALALLALSTGAAAQDATAPSPTKAQRLDAVIVTGTRADNRTESSSLTPIDVVSAKVLQQTGTTEGATARARSIPSLNVPRPAGGDTADQQCPLAARCLPPARGHALPTQWSSPATRGQRNRGESQRDLSKEAGLEIEARARC